MAKKNQSKRLTSQHKKSHGVIGIFGDEAKLHDRTVSKISHKIIKHLKKDIPNLTFRYKNPKGTGEVFVFVSVSGKKN